MQQAYPSISEYSTFTFTQDDFEGPVVDAAGHVLYILLTVKRFFGSDTTTITRYNGDVVAVIDWGSLSQWKHRQVIFTGTTIRASDFLSKRNFWSSVKGFRTGDGRDLFWKGLECYDAASRTSVASYGRRRNRLFKKDSPATLAVLRAYCDPRVLDSILISALLMEKKRQEGERGGDGGDGDGGGGGGGDGGGGGGGC